MHDIHSMGDNSFKTSTIMEIFHLLLKYIHYPELDTKIQEIYDLIETLPDKDRSKEYLKIIVRYVLIAGPLSTERVVQHTKRFPGGEEMVGTAAQEIEEKVKQEYERNRDKWISEAKIANTQDLLIELLEDELDVPSQSMIDNIRSINSYEILRGLFKKARKVNTLEEFAQENAVDVEIVDYH